MSSASSRWNRFPFGVIFLTLATLFLPAGFIDAAPVTLVAGLSPRSSSLVTGQPVITLINRMPPVCDFPSRVYNLFPVQLTRTSDGVIFQPLPYRMLTLTVLTSAGPRFQRCWTSLGGLTRFLIVLPPGIYPANLRYHGEQGLPPVEMELLLRLH